MICIGKSKGDLMPNVIFRSEGPAFVWADETDYAGGSQIGGVRTNDLDLTDLLFGAARQGVKIDLGAQRARKYVITLCIEMKTAEPPQSSETIDLYWGPSHALAAATANVGGLVGTDAAYTGTAAGSFEDSLNQLQRIGGLELTKDVVSVPQRQTWIFEPSLRYGQPVVVNRCDAEDLNNVDAQEMYIRMVPLFDKV